MHLSLEAEERDFAQWQLDIGCGKNTSATGDVTLPDHFKCASNTLQSLVDTVYPGIDDLPLPPDQYFSDRSILAGRNDDVHKINAQILAKFPGQSTTYQSVDSVNPIGEEEIELYYPIEHLNTINASGLPLAKLELKLGCPVIVHRNLVPSQGVCNGTRGIVTRMANKVLEVRLLGGDHSGETVFIPRITLSPSTVDLGFELKRRQFPVSVAFAMTINKAQGQSLKHVGLDLRTPVFTHGQFYVAVSWATSIRRIKAIWDPRSKNAVTKNIVYNEVLLED
jgi:hypothetical protein